MEKLIYMFLEAYFWVFVFITGPRLLGIVIRFKAYWDAAEADSKKPVELGKLGISVWSLLAWSLFIMAWKIHFGG